MVVSVGRHLTHFSISAEISKTMICYYRGGTHAIWQEIYA